MERNSILVNIKKKWREDREREKEGCGAFGFFLFFFIIIIITSKKQNKKKVRRFNKALDEALNEEEEDRKR